MNPLSTLERLGLAALGLLLSALALYGAFVYAKHLGKAELRAELAVQVKKVDAKREAVAAPIAARQKAAQVQIRTVTKTIIEKVPVYVKTDDCPVSGGFRLLHDSAAANEPIPDATAIVDGAAVPAAVVAETVVSNYGTCNANAARLVGLQEWVSAQGVLK